jgi:hypothetical protein
VPEPEPSPQAVTVRVNPTTTDIVAGGGEHPLWLLAPHPRDRTSRDETLA